MTCRRRAILLVAALIVATFALPGLALANPCGGSADIHDRGGEATAECPESGSEEASPEPVGGGGRPCTEERAADPDAWWVSFDVPDWVLRGEARWVDVGDGHRPVQPGVVPPEGQTIAVHRDCHGEVRSGLLFVPEPEPGGVDDPDGIFVAREQARARVEPAAPVFEVSPEQAVVQFTTWLWLDADYWQPATSSSTTPGGVTVEVEARPVEAVWDLDEGVRVCSGPGVPWSPQADAAYELQPESVRGAGNPACTFTFVNASSTRPSGVFDASVTVLWEFSWSLGGSDRGVFGTVEVSQSWPLTVGEIQTVITG
jgi:hypothetical protein